MSGRPIISYDDITLPYDSQSGADAPPPAKKAKTNNHANARQQPHAHWDDPSASTTSSMNAPSGSGSGGGGKKGKKGNNNATGSGSGKSGGNASGSGTGKAKSKAKGSFSVNMSRELTHEEIWDDSALVEAWDAAMEEYEAYNGPGKGWKQEPLAKSALWYNTPLKKNSTNEEDEGGYDADEAYYEGDEAGYEEDAVDESAEVEAGLDPNAQVHANGAHGPSWPGTAPGDTAMPTAYDFSNGPGASLSTVSQDEAFSRALNAMYWGGYWTAVYHCHRGREDPAAAAASSPSAAVKQEQVDVNGVDAVEEEPEPERDEEASSDNNMDAT